MLKIKIIKVKFFNNLLTLLLASLLIIYSLFIARFNPKIFFIAFNENAGMEEAIKRQKVLEIKQIATKHNLYDFNLSYELKKNPGGFSYSSIITLLYPIRYNPESPFIFSMINENMNCSLIEERDKVVLSKC